MAFTNKDEFWSVDRLLPRVHSSFFSPTPPDGVPIAVLEEKPPEKSFGEAIRTEGSRVIRFYRLTEAKFPRNDLILGTLKERKPLPFTPCTLYSPTMLSLNETQREYFYYFCEAVRKRRPIKTSFAYIRLYLCRLLRSIELRDELPDDVVWLWSSYRSEFPLADKVFADFVSDYCFYKKMIPPYEALSPILAQKDFTARPFLLDPFIFDYLFSSQHKISPPEMDFVLRLLTGQSFRRSKAYQTSSVFATACEEAVRRAFAGGLFNREDLNRNLFSIRIPSEVHTVRKLFQALPPEEIPQVEINLCYLPLLNDQNIRERCDELIRYLENRIRSIMKIKNALSRIHISDEHKGYLEAILMGFLHLTPREDEPIPAAEKTETPVREISIDPEEAKRIEADSWAITRELTEDYRRSDEESVTLGEQENAEPDYSDAIKEIERPLAKAESNEFWELAAALSPEEDHFLSLAVHDGKEVARRYAVSLGAFFEAMVASCNEKAMDAIGDAVMDAGGVIFEEYRSELGEVFPQLKGDEA